jgi:ribosomal protein S18 acetylase RimI-like enzyme
MVRLAPMPPAAFAAYRESSIADYAEENVASGRWTEATALVQSREEFDRLLPQGVATAGHHLFEIRQAAPEDTVLGVLWLAEMELGGQRQGYVYHVWVHPEHRRRGHAQSAFLALEGVARELGLPVIGLHVFGHNLGAQELYRKLGYEVTGINMQKRVG